MVTHIEVTLGQRGSSSFIFYLTIMVNFWYSGFNFLLLIRNVWPNLYYVYFYKEYLYQTPWVFFWEQCAVWNASIGIKGALLRVLYSLGSNMFFRHCHILLQHFNLSTLDCWFFHRKTFKHQATKACLWTFNWLREAAILRRKNHFPSI